MFVTKRRSISLQLSHTTGKACDLKLSHNIGKQVTSTLGEDGLRLSHEGYGIIY